MNSQFINLIPGWRIKFTFIEFVNLIYRTHRGYAMSEIPDWAAAALELLTQDRRRLEAENQRLRLDLQFEGDRAERLYVLAEGLLERWAATLAEAAGDAVELEQARLDLQRAGRRGRQADRGRIDRGREIEAWRKAGKGWKWIRSRLRDERGGIPAESTVRDWLKDYRRMKAEGLID